MDLFGLHVNSLRLPVSWVFFPLLEWSSSLSICTSFDIKSVLSDVFYPFSLPLHFCVASLQIISHLRCVCPCVVLQSLSTNISNNWGFFWVCILPKYSQKALADFLPDSGETVPEPFLLIAVGTARWSSTFVGYEGVGEHCVV